MELFETFIALRESAEFNPRLRVSVAHIHARRRTRAKHLLSNCPGEKCPHDDHVTVGGIRYPLLLDIVPTLNVTSGDARQIFKSPIFAEHFEDGNFRYPAVAGECAVTDFLVGIPFISLRKPLHGFSSGFSRIAVAFLMASASSEVPNETWIRFFPGAVIEPKNLAAQVQAR